MTTEEVSILRVEDKLNEARALFGAAFLAAQGLSIRQEANVMSTLLDKAIDGLSDATSDLTQMRSAPNETGSAGESGSKPENDNSDDGERRDVEPLVREIAALGAVSIHMLLDNFSPPSARARMSVHEIAEVDEACDKACTLFLILAEKLRELKRIFD